MTLKEILEAAASVVAKKAKENPDVKLRKGETEFSYTQLSQELKNVASWCYKGEIDTVRVTRCKFCKNYKLYKKKSDPKDKGHMMCSLDKTRKSPEHYCAYGEQEESQ